MQLLCSRTCSAQPATRWLVGRLSALASRATPPRLALTPRTRRMQRCGRPSRRRLRVRRRPAPPEPTGLDLVTVVASPATVRRSATVPSPQKQLISQSGLPQCVRLSFTGREEEQLCLQHCPWTTTQPGRGQRLAGGDDKHSQPNAELAKGRQVRMPCAPVDSTPWMDLERHRGWRCSTRTAAMAPRCQPYVPPHTPATVGGATRSDPPPSLDSEFRKS